MKWTKPKSGAIRTNCGFLILPKTIRRERRWFEYAQWTERYCYIFDRWESRDWINESTGKGFKENIIENLPKIRISVDGGK
jgi:hypothetical protein